MTTPQAPLSLIRHRPFVMFWCARILATSAMQMLAVCVGWQIYALTDNALDLGFVGLAQFIPAFLLMLVAGHIADRHHRGRVIRTAQAVAGGAAALLALGTAQGWITRELILALVFVLGGARAFEMPTMHALLPNLVPTELLPRAVAGSTSANQAATIIGPAFGGFLYLASPVLAYAACAALFASASILISLIRVEHASAAREKASFSTLFAGIDFIRRQPLILGAISLDLFAVLVGGAMALLPIFARDVFNVGPWGLGLLRGAPAVGALLMALALAHLSLRGRAGLKMFAGVAIFGVATIVFALSTSFVLSLLALVVLGASDVVSVVVRQTIVPLYTPDEMRGRVSSVSALFVGTSNQLGDFRAGVVAAAFGAVPAVLIGGIGTLVVVLLWMKMFPALRDVDRLDGPPEAAGLRRQPA